MKRVLVGDDGSKWAAAAVEWARAFATERSLELLAVCVGPLADRAEPTQIDRLMLPNGHPAFGIMEAAVDADADLVVLGRRGSGGFPSLPMGTTAHVVAGSYGRPVAVVPPPFQPAEPLVQHVVVGVDGLPGSSEALRWASSVFRGTRFTVVHAVEVALVSGQLDDDESSTAENFERARTSALARMERWSTPLNDAGASFDMVVEPDGAAESLLGTASRTAADLVVVGRHDHGAFRGTLGGVSQRVLASRHVLRLSCRISPGHPRMSTPNDSPSTSAAMS